MKEGDSTADLKRTLPGFRPHWQRRLWPAATRPLRNGSQHKHAGCFSILRSAGTSLLTAQPHFLLNVSVDSKEQ